MMNKAYSSGFSDQFLAIEEIFLDEMDVYLDDKRMEAGIPEEEPRPVEGSLEDVLALMRGYRKR
jgi:hypothetical protein